MFQDAIWYTVWVWGLYNLDVPHGLCDLIAAVKWGSVAGEECKIYRPRKWLNHCGFRRIIYRLKPSIVTIIQDLAAYSEFDRTTSCGVNMALSESRFPSLAFSSSTAIIPPCLGTLACSSTGHSSNKFRRRFALTSSAQSPVTCHHKLSRFCSCILSVIRVGKKCNRAPCRQHL